MVKRSNQFTNPWKEREIEIVVKLFHEGSTNEEIAEVVGRSRKSINTKLWKLNLKRESDYEKFNQYNWLHQKYIVEELSTTDIGIIAKVHHSTISKWLRKQKIPSRDFYFRTDNHKAKIGKASSERFGEKNSCWKGGKTKTNEGYVYVRARGHPFRNANDSVLEHRLVIEDSIGRFLKPDEVVHHINEIVDDNRLENLHLFKNDKQHLFYHYMKRNGIEEELAYEFKQSGSNWKAYKRSRIALLEERDGAM